MLIADFLLQKMLYYHKIPYDKKKKESISIYLCKRSDKHTPKCHFQTKKSLEFKRFSGFMCQGTGCKGVIGMKTKEHKLSFYLHFVY